MLPWAETEAGTSETGSFSRVGKTNKPLIFGGFPGNLGMSILSFMVAMVERIANFE